MKKNIFLEIEYKGSDYFGFQVQRKGRPEAVTIQGTLEKSLHKLFRQKVRLISSGRTDRGVHAKAQPINFKIDTAIPLANIRQALNSFLPSDIRIKKIKNVPFEFHSRFWAKTKIYRYLIFNRPSPSVFWHDFSWHLSRRLDLGLMEKAGKEISGKRDFSLFAKGAKNYKSCLRELKRITIERKSNLVVIDLEADGFLRQMARNIVYFLAEAGAGKIKSRDIGGILSRKAKFYQKPAPAKGLYLYKVKYR